MLEDFIRLLLEQLVRGLTDQPHDVQGIFIALLVVVQIDRLLVLVIAHQCAAWLDDQLACS